MLHSYNQYIIRGLEAAFQNKKKKWQQGKQFNFIKKKEGGAQFFGLIEVQAAKDYQITKEKEKAQQQQNIINKKALAAANKQQKEKKIYKK